MVCVSAFSCGGRTFEGSLDVDELVANSLAAQAGIMTYRLDLSTMSYQYSGGEGLLQEFTQSIDASAVVDQANHEMDMDITMTVAATGQATETTQMRVFLVGDYLYVGTASSGQDWSWTKKVMPLGYWDEQEALGQQLELLEGSQRKILREENVDGVDCYVLQLTPDLDQLWSVMTQSWTDDMGDVTNPRELIKSCSVTQWVAKDTSLLAKAVVQMNLDLTSYDMVLLTEARVHDYNEPVSINLPSEAES